MHKLLTRGSVLAAALVFGACQDATEPVAVAGSGGSGNDTECRVAGFAFPLTGNFDNVVVPPGAFCFLVNSVVTGNVKALRGSTLVGSNNTVRGSVEGDKANAVQWFGGSVGGNIQIKEGGSLTFFQAIAGVTILPGGNIQVEKVSPASLSMVSNTVMEGNIKVEDNFLPTPMFILSNSVGGNLQVFKNRGPALKSVTGNTVRENLQCFENDPPFVGGPNTAGKSEGQCFGTAPAI